MQTFCTLISFFCRDRIFSTLISFYNHYVTLVYLDIILLPRCDIFYLDFILLLPCTIFYRDTILLPWWNIFYLDIILLPYCDFFHLDIILLPWSHFTTVMEHFVHWYQFGPKILGGGGEAASRAPPLDPPLFILLPWCDILYLDIITCTPWWNIVYLDNDFSTVMYQTLRLLCGAFLYCFCSTVIRICLYCQAVPSIFYFEIVYLAYENKSTDR